MVKKKKKQTKKQKTCLPMQETQEMWVRSLGGEDSLEKEMETHSSILAWRIPWTEEPGRLQFMGSYGLDTSEQLSTHGVLSSRIKHNEYHFRYMILANGRTPR